MSQMRVGSYPDLRPHSEGRRPALPLQTMGVMYRPAIVAPQLKRCWLCEENLPVSEFGVDHSRGNGLRPTCRPCTVLYIRECKARQQNRRQLQRGYQRRYTLLHPAECVVKRAQWYAAHREDAIASAKAWDTTHRAADRAASRRYYQRHRSAILERRREQYWQRRTA